MLIVFDLMDTLLTDPYRQAHEAASGLGFAEFDSLRPPGAYHRLERGEISEGEYWRSIRESGIAFDVDVFHTVRRQGYRWLPGMRELVADCAAVYRTVVGSNYPDWITEIGRDFLTGLGVDVYASYRFGVRKPSADFFLMLCEQSGVTPEELVLVDDKPGNTAAVLALGGRGITFTSAPQARELLGLAGETPRACRPRRGPG
ncbi:HAD-IA family hydrolase [Kitasatospora sp. NPDC048545]|uniref:HAD-IA family hydrolase n=1 Tax=Kitasatospora sp. NPDC048545 TaxID=3157208 RepID=UPI00340B529E